MAAGTRPTAVPVYLGQLVQFGSITSPVLFFDVMVPSGYSRFQLYFKGMTLTAPNPGDTIAAAIQTVPGGFICDNINNDSYYDMNTATLASLITLTPVQTDVGGSQNFGAVALVDIYPGDLNNWPFVSVVYSWGAASAAIPTILSSITWTVDPAATIPPVLGPVTMIRVLPHGNGDINPPTSGETINTGDWRLYAYN